MAGTEYTEQERRTRNLEFEVIRLKAALDSVKAQANKGAQDASQITPIFQGFGNLFFHVQAIGDIDPRVGTTLGTGTGRLLTVIGGDGGKSYAVTDGTAGHHTEFAVNNDTFGTVLDKTYMICVLCNGIMRIILGTCTPGVAYAPDDITAP